jgi:hypothetical protein
MVFTRRQEYRDNGFILCVLSRYLLLIGLIVSSIIFYCLRLFIAEFDPDRGMITGLFPTPYLTVNTAC